MDHDGGRLVLLGEELEAKRALEIGPYYWARMHGQEMQAAEAEEEEKEEESFCACCGQKVGEELAMDQSRVAAPKPGRGRPRKVQVPTAEGPLRVSTGKRGRPRKLCPETPPPPAAHRRPRGRPRKTLPAAAAAAEVAKTQAAAAAVPAAEAAAAEAAVTVPAEVEAPAAAAAASGPAAAATAERGAAETFPPPRRRRLRRAVSLEPFLDDILSETTLATPSEPAASDSPLSPIFPPSPVPMPTRPAPPRAEPKRRRLSMPHHPTVPLGRCPACWGRFFEVEESALHTHDASCSAEDGRSSSSPGDPLLG